MRANLLTDEQKKIIDQNKNELPIREIAKLLNVTYYRVHSYLIPGKRMRNKIQKKGIFNVHQCKNWLADDGKAPNPQPVAYPSFVR